MAVLRHRHFVIQRLSAVTKISAFENKDLQVTNICNIRWPWNRAMHASIPTTKTLLSNWLPWRRPPVSKSSKTKASSASRRAGTESHYRAHRCRCASREAPRRPIRAQAKIDVATDQARSPVTGVRRTCPGYRWPV